LETDTNDLVYSTKTIGAKYPVARAALLESVQAKVGDETLSDTVRRACDELIERHYPGVLARLTK
jgi:hypothetical protein